MKKNFRTQFKGCLILLLTAFIWGTSFVSQSVGMESVDAFTFMAIRTLLGSAVLIPVFLIRDFFVARTEKKSIISKFDKKAIIYGAILGVFLCAATNFQQFAFYYSTAGKIAFITATYMFFIPIAGLFIKKRIPLVTWLCIVMAFIGLYFLCLPRGFFAQIVSEGFGKGLVNKGDLLTLVAALFFTVQILLIEKFSVQCDGIKLSCMQFFTAGFISMILMFIFEKPQLSSIKEATIPILYSGIMSCGVAYTMQIIGQKYCEATIASLLMSMESVFAAISSAIILHERMSGREIIGCAIMFSAIVLSQVGDIIRERKVERKASLKSED